MGSLGSVGLCGGSGCACLGSVRESGVGVRYVGVEARGAGGGGTAKNPAMTRRGVEGQPADVPLHHEGG